MSKFQKKDPDHGPQMKTGDIPFDKGYETSSHEGAYYPENKMRGNRYNELQGEIVRKDESKLKRSKFSKIY